MESIVHLWNVSKFFEKMENAEITKLRMHYVRCCRELRGKVELPKQNFGPSAICPRCGATWATIKHKTRISSGKTPSKRMENLISTSCDVSSRLPKYLHTLMRKCKKNKSNKMIRICSICSEITSFSLNKPKRQRIQKTNPSSASDVTLSSRKKKKRARDRTAGLNLSGCQTPEANRTSDVQEDRYKTPLSRSNKNRLIMLKTPVSTSKPQKLNLTRLKGIIDTNVTPSKKSKLHTFLKELC